jgi:hypothetical protein
MEFDEFRPSIFPNSYKIEASDGKVPKTKVIDDAFYLMEGQIGVSEPFRVPIPSNELAYSLIQDFKNASMFVDSNKFPAVFYIEGIVQPENIIKNHREIVKVHLDAQLRWFQQLIYIADDAWQRFRQHKIINDLHRLAANQLGLDREWLIIPTEVTRCPGCNEIVNPMQAVCGSCRCIINHDVYKTLKFADQMVKA